MGLSDRDYAREESWEPDHAWSRAQNRTGLSITAIVIIVNVVVFFVDMVLSGSGQSVLAPWFEVRSDTIIKPWMWYQFLTFGFLHDLQNILHLAFNMLGLFFFGRTVEQKLGRAEYLRFYLLAIVIGGIVTSLRGLVMAMGFGMPTGPVIGASGAVMAVTILFACYEPHATILFMAVFPVKAWVAAIFFVVSNVLGFIGSDAPVAYDVHLAGIGFAWLYFKQQWKLDWLDFGRWGFSLSELSRRRPRLKLHDPESRMAKEEAEADRLLDKIQATGMESLTSAERRTLERHSRKKRESRNR